MLCAIHAFAFRAAVRLAFMGMLLALPTHFASVGMPPALPVRFASVGMLLVLPACFASVGMLLALSQSASRSWVCCSHCRGPLRVCGYAARITAVRLAFMGMPRALPRFASLRVCGYAACIAGPLRVREYAACIAGSLRVRRDRGDAVSLTLRLCLPHVLPVSTLRDV